MKAVAVNFEMDGIFEELINFYSPKTLEFEVHAN